MSETEWSQWTNDAVITLVIEYEKHEELWCKEHSLNRVQSAKNFAWKSIARVLECEVGDVRKKFNSVMASYRRERAKVKEGGKSNWFLYPYMDFLAGYVKSPDDEVSIQEDETEVATEHFEQIETLDQSFNIDSDDTAASEQNSIEEEVKINPEPPVRVLKYTRYKPSTNSHSKGKLTRTMKRRPKRFLNPCNDSYSKVYVDNRINEVQRMMKTNTAKKDDCDTYGEYIASTLRKHNNKTQCLIKQAINNILFEQEMVKYENPLANEMIGPD